MVAVNMSTPVGRALEESDKLSTEKTKKTFLGFKAELNRTGLGRYIVYVYRRFVCRWLRPKHRSEQSPIIWEILSPRQLVPILETLQQSRWQEAG